MNARTLWVTAVTSGLIAIAGCGGGDEKEPSMLDMLGQAGQMQEAIESLEETMIMPTEPVPAVPFSTLLGYLPESVGGLAGSDPEGSSSSMGEFNFSSATRSYSDDEGSAGASVEINDYAYIGALYAPFQIMMAMEYSRESTSGYERSTKVGDSPGFETWDAEDGSGELTVIVGQRFIVKVNTWGLDKGAARAAVESMNLTALAKEQAS